MTLTWIVLQAASCGYVSYCQRLVAETGYDLNKRSHLGFTLLHIACSAGRLPVVTWLLKDGASISIPDKFGRTVEAVARLSGVAVLRVKPCECEIMDASAG